MCFINPLYFVLKTGFAATLLTLSGVWLEFPQMWYNIPDIPRDESYSWRLLFPLYSCKCPPQLLFSLFFLEVLVQFGLLWLWLMTLLIPLKPVKGNLFCCLSKDCFRFASLVKGNPTIDSQKFVRWSWHRFLRLYLYVGLVIKRV